MYRFLGHPRWLALHAAVLAGIVLMTSLGLWQLRRLDDRREFNATVEARTSEDVVALDAVVLAGTDADPDALQWRPVAATGRYAADESVVIVNRSSDGIAGVNLVVPLVLDGGGVVLVNRGFVPLSVSADPPPTGNVTVVGFLRRSESRRLGGAVDATGTEVTDFQRFDIDAISTSFSGESFPVNDVAGMYLQAASEQPAPGSQWPAPVALPILDEGPHLSYAVQWFFFSACVAAGWVVVVRRGVNDRRRRATHPGHASA